VPSPHIIILLYFTEFDSFAGLLPSQWSKIDLYCLQNIVFHFWPKPTHPAARSLSAIAELLVIIITSDGHGHCQGRNGEFCVTVGPVTRTADILTSSVKGAGC